MYKNLPEGNKRGSTAVMYSIQNPMTKQKIKDRAWRTVWLSFAIGIVMIVPYMIKDSGYFFYYGDFNVQQVPFWRYVAQSIQSGNIGWSWETDLGSPLIPTYSFYMMGSPFFWLALLLPSSIMPYLMGPLLILKMTVAALGAYLLMQKYVRDPDYAVIGALLYAFSSYTIYNIFFNHFIDVVAVFPFLILAFDELVENKRWGYFAFMTAICLMTNYFFFIGQVVFLVIYYFIRVCSKGKWRFNIKTFLHILLEGITGCAASMALMLPSYLMIRSNPRLSGMFNGWGFYVYGETRRYLDILQALLFPPELPHYCYFVEDGNTRWQSVAAWLPLVALACVIAFMINKKAKGTWQKRMMVCFGLALLMPGIGSMFYLLKSTYYSRWLYMAVLVMAMVSIVVLEQAESYDLKQGVKWNAIFAGLLFIPIAFLPVLGAEGNIAKIGIYTRDWNADIMFWICSAISIACMVTFWLLCRDFRFKKRNLLFKKYLTIALTATICVYSIFILTSGKLSSESNTVMIDNGVRATDQQIPGEDYGDNEFFRVDVLDGMDNMGMYWGMSSINFFNSTVSPSIMSFYESMGIERNVATRPGPEYKGLRALTSVKYVFQRLDNDGTPKTSYQSLPALEYVADMNGYAVFKNNAYIPFGFTYNSYTTQDRADTVSQTKRDILMINAVILSEEQVDKYGSLMTLADAPLYNFEYGDEGIVAAAAARAASSCYDYVRSNEGFSVKIDLASSNLVFFTLPFDEGWSCTVNGQPVTIESVNNGMSAVLAQAGHNDIVFTYETPGLKTGTIITIVGIAAILAFFAIEIVNRVRNGKRPLICELSESEYNALPDGDTDPVIEQEPQEGEPTQPEESAEAQTQEQIPDGAGEVNEANEPENENNSDGSAQTDAENGQEQR